MEDVVACVGLQGQDSTLQLQTQARLELRGLYEFIMGPAITNGTDEGLTSFHTGWHLQRGTQSTTQLTMNVVALAGEESR